ncbi:Protein of unknown function [Pyronema omphalodes CBS 100304]|uniref:Uncharacterized protein n=1 Tax=Pyronema omphalodes (strain CBS 100304) TaxID=1076935 RepID=U4LMU5_PYROM|nr:Protein of unknown function [Pyronema omphalodes CBS 100304]
MQCKAFPAHWTGFLSYIHSEISSSTLLKISATRTRAKSKQNLKHRLPQHPHSAVAPTNNDHH